MVRKIFLIVSACILFASAAFAQGSSASTATTTTAVKATAFRPTKDQIKQGQEVLIKEKLYTGAATGVYGESRPAIKAYQKAKGLDESGKFDQATLEKMGIALTDSQKGVAPTASTAKKATASTASMTASTATASTDGPKRPAPFSANKEQVAALQKVLISGKMFSGEANGERGETLTDAVKKYQEVNDLKVTGGINAATLEKAGIALTDKQKANVAAQASYDAAKKN